MHMDEIALGLGPLVYPFALACGASAHGNWNQDGLTSISTRSIRLFESAFREVATKARRIHFNLDGIPDPVAAADQGQAYGFLPGNVTNAELHAVRNDPNWLRKTVLYRGGTPVPSPFP